MKLINRADALVAIGVLQALEGRVLEAVDVVRLMGGLQKRIEREVLWGAARLRVDEQTTNLDLPAEAVESAARAWRDGQKAYRGDRYFRGIALALNQLPGRETYAFRGVLAEAEGVSSMFAANPQMRGRRDWHWPLHIGFSASQALHAEMRDYGHQQLIEIVTLDQPDAHYDLLVVGDVDEIDNLTDQNVSAGMVLILTERPEEGDADLTGRFARRLNASAVAMVPHPALPEQFVQELLDALAHDLTPDVAIALAIDDPVGFTLVADPGFIESARVTAALARTRATLEKDLASKRVTLNEFDRSMSVLEELIHLGNRDWYSERRSATLAAEMTRKVAPTVKESTPRPRRHRGRITPTETKADRYLQAQVFAGSTADEGSLRKRSFEAGAPHIIKVRIGPSVLDWTQVNRPFPAWDLPEDERRYKLTVYLEAPGLFEGIRSQEIGLPRTGESEIACFDVDVPASLTTVEATVFVQHGNKHLQTGVLRGPVSIGEVDSNAIGITFSGGERSNADLDHQRIFDLTFLKSGNKWKVLRRGHEETRPELGDLEPAIAPLKRQIFNAAVAISDLETKLDSGKGLALIRSLAAQGEFLRRKIFGKDSPLEDVRLVQVVSPASSDFFPVEYLYDYGLPNDDAKLCPSFLKKTSGDGCVDCKAAGDLRYVCPSGFWGLNRVIERQVHATDIMDCDQSESSGATPALPAVSHVVLAASEEVNAERPTQVYDTANDIRSQGLVVHEVADWDVWCDVLHENYPALLVALPHNVDTETGFPALRIGADKDLPLNRIETRHVTPVGTETGPVVLLLGCNTANPKVRYQDFVHEIRCKGAAIVVGTITYVLGSQAAPVATELVKRIHTGKGLFGEVMQSVRARSLKKGNIMALAIVAYGDADWRLA